jgi:iron complex transport system ATP-binding protein
MIELDGVHLAYGARPILAGVDLRVERGEVVGVLGRNGAGKTSLLRIALGLLRPDRGVARVDGTDLATVARAEVARRVAAMAQDEPLAFSLTVRECVLLGRVAHLPAHGFETEADLDAAAAAMDEVGVRNLSERALETLSGGERRRVMLARALAQQTHALVLDEPADNLDLAHQLELFELLRARAERGSAILVSVHDLNLALRACDRVALLPGDGTLMAGRPGDILTEARVAQVFAVEAQLADGGSHFVIRGRVR